MIIRILKRGTENNYRGNVLSVFVILFYYFL